MKYKYVLKLDLYSDAWNWWEGCNRVSHGQDWKNKVDQSVIENIYGKSQEEANKFLIPFLKNKYKEEKKLIQDKTDFINEKFAKNFEQGCRKMEEVMGKPLYRKGFTFIITSFGRAPYDKEKGLIFLPYKWNDPMLTFLHELCHFQFIHYWRENFGSDVSKLSENQFEFLKESLTIILDKKTFPMIKKDDAGYELHKQLRRKLKTFWEKEKDFEKLVKYGCEIIN